ncbi:ASM4 (YDL088C) and NUP53 (YMR153W) [Zygosaccharomyces parabailii]|nr:ASM4 (YDL088C) and NUP53 (YMR153W) [Zygosaccharomyces parabailii]CDH13073.1 uncharacterized protein ZBAI_04859 [Zygosaccharomyces bailii ISA1307]
MFAGQPQSTGGSRFANVSVNFPQQQPQQLQQQNAYQSLNQVPSSQQQQQSFLTSGVNQQNGFQPQREPEWFNNPRKRAIPQSIVKRTTKRSPSADSTQADSDAASSTVRSGFNSIAFGSKRDSGFFQPSSIPKPAANVEKNTGILMDSNEAPPNVSLHDWQREDEFGTMASIPPNVNSGSMPNDAQDPSQLSSTMKQRLSAGSEFNAFDKGGLSKNIGKQRADHSREQGQSSQPSSNESAVIVFGYPESISNMVITHFSKFGYILEDFEVLRCSSGINTATLRLHGNGLYGSKPGRKYPIFTGDGWVKLTYDSSSSALRALEENGRVFGGSLIGCVPYNKKAVEQLASCKIEKEDDIGNLDFSVTPTLADNGTKVFGNEEEVPNLQSAKSLPDNIKQESSGLPPAASTANNLLEHSKVTHPSRRLDIKDGKSLFTHNGTADNHYFLRSLESKMRQQELNNSQKSGVLHKLNNWLFGWNEL